MANAQSPQIKDAPRHIVLFINGARTRVFPVVVGK